MNFNKIKDNVFYKYPQIRVNDSDMLYEIFELLKKIQYCHNGNYAYIIKKIENYKCYIDDKILWINDVLFLDSIEDNTTLDTEIEDIKLIENACKMPNKDKFPKSDSSVNSYTIRGKEIITSFESGYIVIEGTVSPINSNGEFELSDELYLEDCISSYLLYKFTILSRTKGRQGLYIHQLFEKDYAKYEQLYLDNKSMPLTKYNITKIVNKMTSSLI